MPFNSSLPEWNKTATAPAQSKKDAGWGANEKPPASIFNWFFNTAYLALQELQQEAINVDQKGVNNGVATLDATGDLPIGQADNILNWVKGFGLGDVAKDISSIDLNNLDATGFYKGNSLTNGPLASSANQYYFVINIKHSATFKTQMAISFNVGSNLFYTRVLNNGTWSAWNQLATQDWVKSFGLGDVAKDVSNTDLNNLDVTGFYLGSNLTNAPGGSTSFWYIINMKYQSGYKGQIAMQFNTPGLLYQRINNNGTWQAWTQSAVIDSNGLLTPATEVKANSILSLGSNQIEKQLGNFGVTNGTANVKADITIPNASIHATIDISVVGQWGNGSASGRITKRFMVVLTAGGAINYQKSVYTEVDGLVPNYIALGDLVWDATNSVFKIQIASLSTLGNSYNVSVKAVATNPTYLTSLKSIAMGATYTTDTTVLPTPVLSNGMTDWVKSFGLGDVGKTATDANALDATGFYSFTTASPSNLPLNNGTYFNVLNIKLSATARNQMAINISTGDVWVRKQLSNTWSAWSQQAQYDSNSKIPIANLPAATTSAAGIAQLVDSISSTDATKAATANSVKLLQDWAKGFGLGDVAKSINGTDLNALDGTGFYVGGSLTNSPNTSQTYYVLNMKHSTPYTLQIACHIGTNAILTRINSNGTWTAWKQLATTDLGTTSAAGLLQLVDSITSTDVTKAATANSVKLALDWVKGFGLGDVAKDITGTDLNALDATGFYRGDTLTNSPSASHFYIINIKHTAVFKTQIAIRTTQAATIYQRINNNGTWSAWSQLATYDATGKIATANLPSSVVLLSANNQLNVANQSNISAIKSDAVSLTSGVDTKLTSFTTEYRDVQNEFDPTLGEVTVKESGVYVIECQVALTATYSGNTYVKVYKGGAAYVNITAATTQQLLYGTVLAQLAAGDKLTFYVVQNSGSTGSLSSAKIEMTKIS